MNTKTLQAKVQELGPWQHLVELQKGVYTIPMEEWHKHQIISSQHYVARTMFPILKKLIAAKQAEKSVIDIGCMDGWLSILFKRHNFKSVLGIDSNPEYIKQANFLRSHFKLDNISFSATDFEDYSPDRTFDISVALGVINHLHNPMTFFEKIFEITNDYLVLDFDSGLTDPEYTDILARAMPDNLWGSIACHFEKGGSFKHNSEHELVYQYSKSAVTMMLQRVGFCNLLEVVPRLAIPEHYRRKRVFILAEKQSNKNQFMAELDLEEKYRSSPYNFISQCDPIPVFEKSTDSNPLKVLPKQIEPGVTSFETFIILKEIYKQYIAELSENHHSYYVWGVSGFYEKIRDIFNKELIEAFVDSDTSKIGGTVDGKDILPPSQLKHKKPKPIFICSTYKKEIYQSIKRELPQFILIP